MYINDISNVNVELLKVNVMVNNQECRIVNAYMHVDSLTNDYVWDFLKNLLRKNERLCLIAGNFNVCSRE